MPALYLGKRRNSGNCSLYRSIGLCNSGTRNIGDECTSNCIITDAAVSGKLITGYVSGAGTVAATDSILQAIQKLNGNNATNANLTGVVTSVGNATSIANSAITNAMLANFRNNFCRQLGQRFGCFRWNSDNHRRRNK